MRLLILAGLLFSLTANAQPRLVSTSSSPGYQTVQQTGTSLTRRRTVNFTGAGVTCVDNAGAARTDCTVASSGGSNVVAVTVVFGSGATNAATVVTGLAWVTGTSIILCAPTLLAASGRLEGAEDAIIEGLTIAVSNRVAGDGFTVSAAVAQKRAFGSFIVHCTGA